MATVTVPSRPRRDVQGHVARRGIRRDVVKRLTTVGRAPPPPWTPPPPQTPPPRPPLPLFEAIFSSAPSAQEDLSLTFFSGAFSAGVGGAIGGVGGPAKPPLEPPPPPSSSLPVHPPPPPPPLFQYVPRGIRTAGVQCAPQNGLFSGNRQCQCVTFVDTTPSL